MAAGNRPDPVDTVLPHVVYRNLPRAQAWLNGAFGFEERYRYGDPPAGAQIRAGRAVTQVGIWHAVADDLSGRCGGPLRHGESGGSEILEVPHETEYGEYRYAAQDPDGHHWLFSRHARDRSPEEWGAVVKAPD